MFLAEQHSGAPLQPMPLPRLPENPLVSVLIANRNYGKYIGQAIESVLAQTYKHLQICICDDGSTDDSVAVIEQYLTRGSPVTLVRREHLGVAAALNAAYHESKGEIVCLLDADDMFLPEKVEAVVRVFRQEEGAGMCLHHFERFSTSSNRLDDSRQAKLPAGWLGPTVIKGAHVESFIPTSGLSFRRAVTDAIFPIPTTLKAYTDAYLARTALFVTKVASINRILMRYRMHNDNLSSRQRWSPSYAAELLGIITVVHKACATFLERTYGPGIAKDYKIENDPHYWFVQLLLAAVSAPRPAVIGGVRFGEALARVPRNQRLLIQAVWHLPPKLSVSVLSFWLGNSTAKYKLRKALLTLCPFLRWSSDAKVV